jgi:predicted GNAT superfamily acetyltransferase
VTPAANPPEPDHTARAVLDGERAAERAGVVVRSLVTHEEFDAARDIWDVVWPTPPGATEITPHLMRALHHAGGYVGGAYAGDRMVGSCLGFVGRSLDPDGRWHTHLHSQVAAALPGFGDRGIGAALKLHQRGWALGEGLDRIEWTFDPLVRRNARLNLMKLGGVAVSYLPDFYGEMADDINAGDPSDRFILQWDIASERVESALAGELPALTREAFFALGAEAALRVGADEEPVVVASEAPVRLVAVPADIVAMRKADPGLASRWRLAVREVIEPVVSAGGRVVAQTVEGDYVVEVVS